MGNTDREEVPEKLMNTCTIDDAFAPVSRGVQLSLDGLMPPTVLGQTYSCSRSSKGLTVTGGA